MSSASRGASAGCDNTTEENSGLQYVSGGQEESRDGGMNSAELLAAVQAKFPDLQEIPKVQGQAPGVGFFLGVPPVIFLDLSRFLLFDPPLSFDFLSFITSIDWKTHFEVVYYLVSTLHRHKVVFKVKLEDRV